MSDPCHFPDIPRCLLDHDRIGGCAIVDTSLLVSVIEMAVKEIVANEFGHATGVREMNAPCWLRVTEAPNTGVPAGRIDYEWYRLAFESFADQHYSAMLT
jgi:hypothetical protein